MQTDRYNRPDSIYDLNNYIRDLRKDAKVNHNEIDLVHSNFLIQSGRQDQSAVLLFLGHCGSRVAETFISGYFRLD